MTTRPNSEAPDGQRIGERINGYGFGTGTEGCGAMTRADRDALNALACEIELRPRGAPGIGAIAKAVRNVTRDGERSLAVSFDPAAARDIEAFVAAEQRCCSTLMWTLTRDAVALRLTIEAQPQQIDVLEELFTTRR